MANKHQHQGSSTQVVLRCDLHRGTKRGQQRESARQKDRVVAGPVPEQQRQKQEQAWAWGPPWPEQVLVVVLPQPSWCSTIQPAACPCTSSRFPHCDISRTASRHLSRQLARGLQAYGQRSSQQKVTIIAMTYSSFHLDAPPGTGSSRTHPRQSQPRGYPACYASQRPPWKMSWPY